MSRPLGSYTTYVDYRSTKVRGNVITSTEYSVHLSIKKMIVAKKLQAVKLNTVADIMALVG